jgi:hypothetical protein
MTKRIRITLVAMLLITIPVLAQQEETIEDVSSEDSVVCTMEYAPVCGAAQVQCITEPCYPMQVTFGNKCELDAQ